MSLSKLQLLNFQTHKRLTINLDPHITTVVGPTDTGKSAVVRAIRWLFFNRPSGDAHMRWGAKKVAVRLRAEDTLITRVKAPGVNNYRLNNAIFAAIGKDVPREVTTALGVTEENIQQQAEPHFWLTATPGEAGKALNAVVNLEIIDKVLGKLDSGAKRYKIEVTVAKLRLGIAKDNMEALTDVPSFSKGVRHLSRLHDKADSTVATAVSLEAAQAKAHQYRKAAKQPVPNITALSKLRAKALVEQGKADELIDIMADATLARSTFNYLMKGLNKAKIKFTEETKGELCPVCQKPL